MIIKSAPPSKVGLIGNSRWLDCSLEVECVLAVEAAHPPEHLDTVSKWRGSSPQLPSDVTIDEIERHLDRIAMAVAASPYRDEYVELYNWLEGQLSNKQRRMETMISIENRVRRLQDRTGAPS